MRLFLAITGIILVINLVCITCIVLEAGRDSDDLHGQDD